MTSRSGASAGWPDRRSATRGRSRTSTTTADQTAPRRRTSASPLLHDWRIATWGRYTRLPRPARSPLRSRSIRADGNAHRRLEPRTVHRCAATVPRRPRQPRSAHPRSSKPSMAASTGLPPRRQLPSRPHRGSAPRRRRGGTPHRGGTPRSRAPVSKAAGIAVARREVTVARPRHDSYRLHRCGQSTVAAMVVSPRDAMRERTRGWVSLVPRSTETRVTKTTIDGWRSPRRQ